MSAPDLRQRLLTLARRFGLDAGPAASFVDEVVEEATRAPPPAQAPSPAQAPLTAQTPLPGLEPADALGRYQRLGLLGQGGMGEVLRVRDPALNRVVAMKIIRADLMGRPDIVARFVEEAQATAQLAHPGVVPVHELGTLADGRIYFTMEEVQGHTLREALEQARGAPWPADPRAPAVARLLEVFLSACRAVAYAHSQGVLHRDLKPSNIMIGAFGAVYVLDWGIAKVLAPAGEGGVVTDRSAQGAHRTARGQVLGTPKYMAPEQANGLLERLGPHTDVYSLGVILFEVLTGRRPEWGVLDPALRPEAPPEEAPVSGLREIVRRALAFDVDLRQPDAGALHDEVRGWLDD